jgi:hypothetical protein
MMNVKRLTAVYQTRVGFRAFGFSSLITARHPHQGMRFPLRTRRKLPGRPPGGVAALGVG